MEYHNAENEGVPKGCEPKRLEEAVALFAETALDALMLQNVLVLKRER